MNVDFTVLWLTTLGFTLLVELPLAVLLAGRGRRRRVLGDALLLNLMSHSGAVALYLTLELPILLLEAIVATAETLGYRELSRLSWGRSLALAVACNAASAVAWTLFETFV